eukprot:m.434522 g.434522  ORF g.434522 m.434522 type:complete len:905 (-) comp17727_c0_seq1:109-2823(-)
MLGKVVPLLSMAAAAMAQGVPQIVTRGDNVMVQSGPTGDISFQTGSANTAQNSSINSILSQMSTMNAAITTLQTRVQTLEDSMLPTNVSVIQYTSNMNSTWAALNNQPNDVRVLVGRFATSQSLSISIDDRGACSGFSMQFTVVSRYNANQYAPVVYSAGAADTNRHALVQWYYVGTTHPGYYYLWLYMPPWPQCGLNGMTPSTHTLTVRTQTSSVINGATFTPAADAAQGSNPLNLPNNGNPPAFTYFTAGNFSGIRRLTTNIHATESDIVPTINTELNRASMTVQWRSNMNANYLATSGYSNDLQLLVGKFQSRSVLTASVSNIGLCLNLGQDFTIVSTWGVHLTNQPTPQNAYPEVFSFGTAAESVWQQSAFQWYFKANGTDLYYLWLYIAPLPLCGRDGNTAFWQTTTVTIQSSTPVDQTWVSNNRPAFNIPTSNTGPGLSNTGFGASWAPAFDFPQVQNASGIFFLPTQVISSGANLQDSVNSALTRVQYQFTWASNMVANYAATSNPPYMNSLGRYLGRMSVNSVVTIAISDEGWCSGTATEYKVMGRWGVHYTNYTQTGARDPSAFTPVAYSVGEATGAFGTGLTATDVFQLYFSPVGRTGHLYNLFLYIPPFPTCGSRGANNVLGTVPRWHTTSVTLSVDGRDSQAVLNGTTRTNDGTTVPFDLFNFGNNSTNILPVNTQSLDPANSDVFKAMVSKSINRYQTSFRYSSNMAPATAIATGNSNNLTALLGKMSTSNVIEMQIEDVGWCSGMGMSFVIVGRWGIHLAPTSNNAAYHPEIFTFGSATEWLFNPNNPSQQAFQFFFAPVATTGTRTATDKYWLYLYIPPWPTCGSPQPPANPVQYHTATVTMTVSNAPSNGLTYEQMFLTSAATAPPFNYYSGNSSNLIRISTQVTAPL